MDPRTDIATVALQQLRDLVGGWGCAAYVPDARTHLMPAELAACDDQPYFFGKYEKDPAKRQAAYDLARRGIRRDMTPFLRVGFHQVDEVLKDVRPECVHLLRRRDPACAIPMSYEEASAPGLVMPAPPLPRPADAELSDFLSSLCTHARNNPIPEATMRRVMTFVAQLVTQQGACVRKARALHYCAAHSRSAWPWRRSSSCSARSAAGTRSTTPTPSGATPLMLAANTVDFESPIPHDAPHVHSPAVRTSRSRTTGSRPSAATALASEAASRSAKGSPRTSAGGPKPLPKLNFEVEGLLTPSDGPTTADKAA